MRAGPGVSLLVRRGLGVNVTNFMRLSWVEDEMEEQMQGEDADQVRIPGSDIIESTRWVSPWCKSVIFREEGGKPT